jgi:hypothetical protein
MHGGARALSANRGLRVAILISRTGNLDATRTLLGKIRVAVEITGRSSPN